MADPFEPGHRETQNRLPTLLQTAGKWYPGTWALPATTLSAASLVVFLMVLGYLQMKPLSRALFRFPFPASYLAVPAALLAWFIVWRCRTRPGRHWPRYWALFMASVATIIALVCLAGGEIGRSPLFHTLAMASSMASLTLAFRLVKLHPDRRLVQHLAPLVLLTVLFVGLPASFAIGDRAIEEQRQRIEQAIQELSRQAHEVREVSGYNWTQMDDQPEDAARQVARLEALPLESWVPDKYVWRGAAILGEEQRLAEAYIDLVDALAESFDPARTPKLEQPQFNWNPDLQQWEQVPSFPVLGEVVATYHRRSGELFRQLQPTDPENEALRRVQARYSTRKEEIDGRLKALFNTWAESWVAFTVPGHEGVLPQSQTRLEDLVQRPLLADGSLRPADLPALLRLRLSQAREVADRAPACDGKSYTKDDIDFFRLNCYTYAPAPQQARAEVRIELRVVYRAAKEGLSIPRSSLPAESYFIFPVPPGREKTEYQGEVWQALAAAIRQVTGEMLTMKDWGNSPNKGFSLRPEDHLLQVRPDEIPYPGTGAIAARAYYSAPLN